MKTDSRTKKQLFEQKYRTSVFLIAVLNSYLENRLWMVVKNFKKAFSISFNLKYFIPLGQNIRRYVPHQINRLDLGTRLSDRRSP